jgi:general stress protein 26
VDNKTKKLFETIIEKAPAVILTTMDENNCPKTRAMLNLPENTLEQIWFTTNTSSEKLEQIKNNNKANAYFCIPNTWTGLLLVGKIKILDDMKVKKNIWKQGWEMYYSKGVNDPDYTVLCFETQSIEYYSDLKKQKFVLN